MSRTVKSSRLLKGGFRPPISPFKRKVFLEKLRKAAKKQVHREKLDNIHNQRYWAYTEEVYGVMAIDVEIDLWGD